MSVATIEYRAGSTATERRTRDVKDVDVWLTHAASLRRVFATQYVPRHRAEDAAI
jgi:hypothetical protein